MCIFSIFSIRLFSNLILVSFRKVPSIYLTMHYCHVIVPLTSFFMSCDRIVWSRATPLANARLMSPLHMVFLCFSTSFHNKSLVESPIPFVYTVHWPAVVLYRAVNQPSSSELICLDSSSIQTQSSSSLTVKLCIFQG